MSGSPIAWMEVFTEKRERGNKIPCITTGIAKADFTITFYDNPAQQEPSDGFTKTHWRWQENNERLGNTSRLRDTNTISDNEVGNEVKIYTKRQEIE